MTTKSIERECAERAIVQPFFEIREGLNNGIPRTTLRKFRNRKEGEESSSVSTKTDEKVY
jgi:hypothetical protein